MDNQPTTVALQNNRKIFQKIFLYVATALLLLYIVRELEYTGIRKMKGGEFGKLREAFLEKQDYDILLIGSSRIECQLHPKIIEETTGLPAYNLGLIGATLPLIRTSLEAWLENSAAPKYIVLNLDLHSLADSPDTIFEFSRYFPYLSNKKLRRGLEESDERFRWFRIFPFYSMPYFSARYLDASLHGWRGRPTFYDKNYYQGYAPSVKDVMHGDLDTIHYPAFRSVPQSYFREEITRIDSLCKTINSQLILVISPLFSRYEASISNYGELLAHVTEIAINQDIALMNMADLPFSTEARFFNDHSHLNEAGALLFSREFSIRLGQYIAH